MAKQSLESQVRGALIQQRIDESVGYAAEDSNYRTIVTEVIETLADSMIEVGDSILSNFDEEQRKEMLREERAEIILGLRAQMDNPLQLRRAMEKQAEVQYMSSRQLKTKLGLQFKELRTVNEDNVGTDEAIDETALRGFENSFEELFEYVRYNDEIIRRLVTIAKQEGLDVATHKDIRYRVTRELFPTPNDYRTYATSGIEVIRRLFQQMQSSLMADGRTGQLMGITLEVVSKGMEKALEMGKRLEYDYLEKTIKEIYGEL